MVRGSVIAPVWLNASRHMTLVLVAVVLMLAGRVALAQERVAVLLSERGGHYSEFLDAFYRALADPVLAGRPLTIVELTTVPERAGDPRLAGVSALVAVGVQAMRSAAARDDLPPTLNVLVPRASYERTVAESGRHRARAQFSAIYLDQPLSRQLGLIRLVLPGKRRVAVLLGPDSSFFLPRLRAAVARTGLELVSDEVSAEFELIPALSQLLGGADLLLALPDSVVFTRESARSILLTAYRYQKPMFGFSQAYVNAGALAAVFSTPAQIARQTVEMLRAQPNARQTLPLALYPTHFSVSVNRAVARALAIDPPADGALHAALASETDSD
ncbi:hypothetical protein CKO20_05635 [Rhodocyclus tenuis]|nr:hypothetical protein [Rhodocyclus tenuis]